MLLRPMPGASAEALLHRFNVPGHDAVHMPGGSALARVRGEAASLRAKAGDGHLVEPNRTLHRGLTVQTGPPRGTPATPMTWGLAQIGITNGTQATGRGASVAVLDSGLDFEHPDFRNRVDPEDVARIIDADPQDPDGHGTHCAGIIAGPVTNDFGTRYGVAPNARLLIANIYEFGKQTTDWHLLRGLLWAADRGADVVSLSLRSSPRDEVEPFSELFEAVARHLLERGVLIVAAAGNSSDRWEPFIGPIEHPADCPSIIAVGATNRAGQTARFSAGGGRTQRTPTLAAPGVAIDSAYARVRSGAHPPYRALTGTSQAAPHVAGVAALWVERGFRGKALRDQLLATALPSTSLAPRTAALVQAPR
jgi:subtilisin family serine protease